MVDACGTTALVVHNLNAAWGRTVLAEPCGVSRFAAFEAEPSGGRFHWLLAITRAVGPATIATFRASRLGRALRLRASPVCRLLRPWEALIGWLHEGADEVAIADEATCGSAEACTANAASKFRAFGTQTIGIR